MNKLDKATREGREAFRQKLHISLNPYFRDEPEREAWREGYLEASEEVEDLEAWVQSRK
jgi:hypothetical protein